MKHLRIAAAVALSCLAAAGLAAQQPPFSADLLRQWLTVISSDEFEGRAPGTRGEDRTVAYLEGEFRRLGLKPGNPDGTYVQQVPLVGLTSRPALSFQVGTTAMPLTPAARPSKPSSQLMALVIPTSQINVAIKLRPAGRGIEPVLEPSRPKGRSMAPMRTP